MRKANKILMATVAILLCLVLITTSVASGIFAKFVITKSGTATLTLTKFGVKLDVNTSDKLADLGASVSAEKFTSTGYEITISGLKLKPGDDLADAVSFVFTGKPNVSVKIKITPSITYTNIHVAPTYTGSSGSHVYYYNYYIPQIAKDKSDKDRNLNLVSADTFFMPVGFTFSSYIDGSDDNKPTATGNYIVDPWQESIDSTTVVSASAIQTALRDGIKNSFDDNIVALDSTDSDIIVVTPTIGTDSISFKLKDDATARSGFYLGFAYPLDWSSKAHNEEFYNRVSTYLGEHTRNRTNDSLNASMTVTYRVEIVQS